MKIPSLRSIESVVRMVPVVKDLLPSNKAGLNSLINESEFELSKLVKKVKQQEDTIYAKKNEIEILKRRIELLEETIGGYQSWKHI